MTQEQKALETILEIVTALRESQQAVLRLTAGQDDQPPRKPPAVERLIMMKKAVGE